MSAVEGVGDTDQFADRCGEVHIVEPSRGLPRLELAEPWKYRELAWFWALRDIRYKQTALGVGRAAAYPIFAVGLLKQGLSGVTAERREVPERINAKALGALLSARPDEDNGPEEPG